jgi:hypothetical protein
MEGLEFFPDGFARSFSTVEIPKYARMVYYDDIKSIKVEKFSDQYYRLTIALTDVDDSYEMSEDLSKLIKYHDELLAKFLEYKRRQPKKVALERLAQAHEALAGHAERFMNEIEIVPGIPGRDAEAAVDRCNNRKRAREEGKEE